KGGRKKAQTRTHGLESDDRKGTVLATPRRYVEENTEFHSRFLCVPLRTSAVSTSIFPSALPGPRPAVPDLLHRIREGRDRADAYQLMTVRMERQVTDHPGAIQRRELLAGSHVPNLDVAFIG